MEEADDLQAYLDYIEENQTYDGDMEDTEFWFEDMEENA